MNYLPRVNVGRQVKSRLNLIIEGIFLLSTRSVSLLSTLVYPVRVAYQEP